MNTQGIKEISSVSFGVFSPEEIMKISVCEVCSPKKTGYNTVYDPRMGTTDSSKPCETCGENANFCPGHFGHVELNQPIVHPLMYKKVLGYLNCFCVKCNRLLLTKDQIFLYGYNRYKGYIRYGKIKEKIKKVDICCHEDCATAQPKFRFLPTESVYTKTYEGGRHGEKVSVTLTVPEIQKTFNNIRDEDVRLLGFDPELIHPRNLIISVLPVLPHCDRPFVRADGNICDDDLTNQYIEIVKINNHLKPYEEGEDEKPKEISESKRQKLLASLRFRIFTTFNNSQGKAKHTTNGRPIKGIKERLAGKDGQIRNNMMGKRCNQTGRTVIGPDPTLKLGELAVPREMAQTLTVPVKVTDFNFDSLQKIVNDGDAHSILKANGSIRINLDRYRRGTRLVAGDIIHRNGEKIKVLTGRELIISGDKIERDGVILDKIISSGRKYPIQKGWVVERKLRDDDYVLLNRQPTLHKASMLAMRVKIKPGKTLRFNLAATKPFNADFDGDEMNIHVPQTLESQAELKYLSAAQWNIISPQSSKPNMAIVQDSLLGSYRMTQGVKKIRRDQFFDIINKLDLDFNPLNRIYHIRRILKEKGKKIQCYNGKGLVSMILPKDLIYEKNNGGDESEPVIKIYRGVLYEGTLNKAVIGASHNSLIQVIHKEYGAEMASKFIDHIQFISNHWLLIEGFTVGLGDCLVKNPKKVEEIQDVIKKCYIEAEGLKNTTNHPVILEMRINAALNKAKDIGLKIAKDALDKNNNFLSTVNSGSKGDFFNIAQITGLLGQQNLKGKRVPLFLNNGKRSLPHYPFGKLPPKEEYESRGFIASSFINGLNPREFYFHAMSGREGICDTAMGTATSGYMQRRIVKLTEDIKVQYDGTIRDVPGHIYQLAYGENSLDSTCTVKVKGKQEFCDVSRLVAKLNMKYELQNKKKKKVHK